MPILSNAISRLRTSGSNPALGEQRASGLAWPARSLSGITVTDDKALGLTAVYRSVTLISTTAGGQPIHVHHEKADGTAERLKTDDTRYLWGRPNREMTRQTYWETVVGHETMGDAFLFVVKDGRGRVMPKSQAQPGDDWGVWYVEPWRTQTGRTSDGRKIYVVDHNEDAPMIDFAEGGEIIHVPNWGRNSLRGINPLSIAPAAISLGLSAQEYAERFFSQDSTPRGLLTSEQVISPEDADRIIARWERNNATLARAHRIAVLGNGAKFQPISISPEDAQLLEERRFQLAEIARLFGIPPHMLGDTERSTSWGSGIEEQTRGFLTFTLQPHINRFEQAIDDALLKREGTDRYVKFDLGGLLRPNLLQRYQAYAMGYGRWLTPNDIRRDEDLPPIDGGDELLAAVNLVPIDQLGLADNPPVASQNGNRA